MILTHNWRQEFLYAMIFLFCLCNGIYLGNKTHSENHVVIKELDGTEEIILFKNKKKHVLIRFKKTLLSHFDSHLQLWVKLLQKIY